MPALSKAAREEWRFGKVSRDTAAVSAADVLQECGLLARLFKLHGHGFHDRVGADADDVAETFGGLKEVEPAGAVVSTTLAEPLG